MKKVLIILAHPDGSSYNGALAEAYARGALQAGHEVKLIKLGELSFDPILHKGYKEIQVLEPDLKRVQEEIKWSRHLVLVFPTWWGSFPALLKGFIDRVVLPGFAFKYHKNDPLWDKLLKGRSGRIITTMGGPSWFYTLFWFSPGVNAVKKAFLGFCGVDPVRVTKIDQMTGASEKKLKMWLKRVEEMGSRAV